MNEHGRPRAALAAHAVAVAALLLAACSGPAGPTSAAHSQPSASAGGGASQPAAGAPGGTRQVVLGETLSSDLVLVDPRTGTRTSTIASGVAQGAKLSVTADGSTIYYEHDSGCAGHIYSVPAAGGSPTLVTTGTLPALSPDGSRLAYASETTAATDCVAGQPPPQDLLVVRDLRTGSETTYRAAPQLTQSGLTYPIDYLSWSADGRRLLVSLAEVQDNEGWALDILDLRTAKYYRTGVPREGVPVTGDPSGRTYYREGVFMPDGNLFVNRVCCVGLGNGPLRTSTLMWEVTSAGAQIKQVAIGFTDRDHTSLDVDRAGAQLLYLSGTDLYVSDGGQRPRLVTSGLLSAAFISTAQPR
jgi:hypothetical protein